MGEWKDYLLGELIANKSAELQTGPFGTMLNASEYANEGTPVIAVQDIGENKLVYHKFVFVDESTAQRLFRYRVKENDIIFGRKGAVERRALINKSEEGWIQGSDCIRLRFSDGIDPKFVSYQFGTKYYQEWMFQNAGGATMPSLNQSILKELPIRLPSLVTQTAIASVLSSLDDKIDLLHRQNATLENMAETLFRRWFVEEAKEEWEEGKLSDLVIVKYGKDHKKLLDGNIPVYGSGGLMRYAEKSLYDKESVLIPRKGTLNNVMYQDEPFWTVDTMFYTEMKVPNVAKFVYQFMKEQDLESMNVGSAVPSMTTEILNNMPLDLPHKEVFERYEKAVLPIYKKIKSNQTQIRTLTAMRDNLLPKLMSGEVKVDLEEK